MERDAKEKPVPQGVPAMSRRTLFNWGAHGLATMALGGLLHADAASRRSDPRPHFAPKARRAINIYLVGGLSQIDSFDYKPELEKYHGKPPPLEERPRVFFGRVGRIRKHDWRFSRHGESGLWMSDLFPHLATMADELAIIRSMHSETANHTPALFLSNSGFQFNGFPSVGSWLSHGLGRESESLPTYVVLPDARGAPSGGASSWSSGFLPAQHQGVKFGAGEEPVRDLFPPQPVTPRASDDVRELLRVIGEHQLERLGGSDAVLGARLRSYELAARLQLSVPEVSDLRSEPESVTSAYGLHQKPTADFARSCIVARRLIERGVRYVQLFSGGPLGGKPRTSWDGHEDMVGNHGREAKRIDRPVAALLRDLKQRGLLEDTLVTFTTEFGRTPFTQAADNAVGGGRDHNNAGFSVWLAGAGVTGGIAHGATDAIGYAAAESPVTWHDFHATVLHLFGLDHERLTFYHNGIERRLTNVHGHVLRDILA